mmetsp:Transcript_21633/g.40431  ORF Transcript_21633/g.40431 Transcript_21633/m.40431 type:complete len:279 (-) Transcript_21633:41-877(-)
MYCLYSSKVVAPMHRSSPRAKAGFKILAALTEPSPPPAPISICSSSIKSTTSPLLSSTSFSTAFKRSSNSPRNFAPAIRAAKSNETTFLPLSDSGTSPSIMRCASPSTTAVLPTPGSPISTGLFFVLLLTTWTVLRISCSLPITGSNLPFFACSVRSTPYFFRLSPFGAASGAIHGWFGWPPCCSLAPVGATSLAHTCLTSIPLRAPIFPSAPDALQPARHCLATRPAEVISAKCARCAAKTPFTAVDPRIAARPRASPAPLPAHYPVPTPHSAPAAP